MAAALPPFGWWPLAVVGVGLLAWAIDGQGWRARAKTGLAFGLGWMVPGFWWMTEFSAPGALVSTLLVAMLNAGAEALVTPGRWAALGLPAALVGVEALRGAWPFGGVPVALLAQTQSGSPLAQIARLGGSLTIAAAVAAGGVSLAGVVRRHWWRAGISAAVAVAVTVAGLAVAPPAPGAALSVALVQGGGERGTRAIDSSTKVVFDAHLAAAAGVPTGTVLTLLPEDVVKLESDVTSSSEGDQLAQLARALDSTVVVGLVQDVSATRFRNFVKAWSPAGAPGPEYTKNQRVPYGEWIPFRSMIERVADVGAVPRDATVGHGPGVLDTDAGRLGVVISYEVFFPRRARDAVKAGGEVLLVPTNASSYSNAQMPSLELGAARLRAIETGRWVAQAAPTGFSAFVDPDGRVHQHSDLGPRQVETATIDRRTGLTLYTRLGDGPFVVGAVLLLGLAWLLTLADRRRAAPAGSTGQQT
ncbi:MAG TPA: apolipoprotein N-acyltransferase [Acidimicrobiales bacterium]